MQRLARWIARRLWWASIWLMRRPWMRRLQNGSVGWMGPSRAERARRSLVRQDALARRIGLPLITFLVTAVLASLAFQAIYTGALYLVESGVLRPPRFAKESREP